MCAKDDRPALQEGEGGDTYACVCCTCMCVCMCYICAKVIPARRCGRISHGKSCRAYFRCVLARDFAMRGSRREGVRSICSPLQETAREAEKKTACDVTQREL